MLFRSVMNSIPSLVPTSPDSLKKASPFLHNVLNDLDSESHKGAKNPLPLTAYSSSAVQQKQVLHAEHTQAFQMQQSGSTSLKIVTQDGDEITLQMHSEWQVSAESGKTYSQNGQGQQYSQYASLQQYQGYAIQYQVEGELDEGELEALDKLMEQVSGAANQFFSGDLAGAVSDLSQFELDASEFTQMSLTMQRSVTYSMAEAYKEVSQMAPASPPSSGDKPTNLLGLSSFVHDMQAMMDEVNEHLDRILMPYDFVGGLMEQAIERDPRSDLFGDELMEKIDNFLTQVLDELHPVLPVAEKEVTEA